MKITARLSSLFGYAHVKLTTFVFSKKKEIVSIELWAHHLHILCYLTVSNFIGTV